MITIKNYGPGSVTYTQGDLGREKSVKKDGNVTIVNEAIPASPDYYNTNFFIGYEQQLEGAEIYNSISLSVIDLKQTQGRTYSEIENVAANKIPTLLRELANVIETTNKETELKREAALIKE